MNKVAVIMTYGITDRINTLELALEMYDAKDIDILWVMNDSEYEDVTFYDYFNFVSKSLKVINVKPTNSFKRISSFNDSYKNLLLFLNISKPGYYDLSGYTDIFSHRGLITMNKYIGKKPILAKNHIAFNFTSPPITNSSFIGVHLRGYDFFRKDKDYLDNLKNSFEEIYEVNKDYFLATDSEEIEKYFSNKTNILTVPRIFSADGYALKSKENTINTLNEINNLGNCGVIYRSIGGWAYTAAIFSNNSPEVKQLSIKNNYRRRR